MGFWRRTLLGRDLDDPIPGTTVTLWPAVSSFIDEVAQSTGLVISPAMAEKVWVAARCIQLNAQQIASMPLEFHSTAPGGGFTPAWISNPDPGNYPNGISDALFAIVAAIYGYGYALLYVTSTYANGYPSGWTLVNPRIASIGVRAGRKVYKAGEDELDPRRVVQIDRNPSSDLHGTPALSGFASHAWAVLSSAELARTIMVGGVPQAVLKPKRAIKQEQAESLQGQWVTATQRRGGAPPVLPPEIEFETLSLSPKDLMLLEGQEFSSRMVANAYGVPASLLNMAVTGGLTYQNPAMLGEQWWRFELRPTSKRIADAMTAQLLPAGNWVTLDASDTFAPIVAGSEEDDPQRASEAEVQIPAVASASPAQNGQVVPIGGGSRI